MSHAVTSNPEIEVCIGTLVPTYIIVVWASFIKCTILATSRLSIATFQCEIIHALIFCKTVETSLSLIFILTRMVLVKCVKWILQYIKLFHDWPKYYVNILNHILQPDIRTEHNKFSKKIQVYPSVALHCYKH